MTVWKFDYVAGDAVYSELQVEQVRMWTRTYRSPKIN